MWARGRNEERKCPPNPAFLWKMMSLTPQLERTASEQVKSLKKTPLVKHRAPWKQPFQLVPD